MATGTQMVLEVKKKNKLNNSSKWLYNKIQKNETVA